MRVVVHTHITNALSRGYLAYLACIGSWLRVADAVVVVDGGSTDNSLALLRDWLGAEMSRVQVVASPATSWGGGSGWAWPQIVINRQAGFVACARTADWAIHVDADHVVADHVSHELVREVLSESAPGSVLDLRVGPYGTRPLAEYRRRTWIVRTARDGASYGMDETSLAGLDYPIVPTATRSFRDPETGYVKEYPVGNPVTAERSVPIDTHRYGHFFFDREQRYEKCRRIDEAISRFLGWAPASPLLLRAENGFLHERHESLNPDQHPEPIRRVIKEFWSDEMLGLRTPTLRPLVSASARALGLARKVATHRLRRLGLRGLADQPDNEIVDVRELYARQDALLGIREMG